MPWHAKGCKEPVVLISSISSKICSLSFDQQTFITSIGMPSVEGHLFVGRSKTALVTSSIEKGASSRSLCFCDILGVSSPFMYS